MPILTEILSFCILGSIFGISIYYVWTEKKKIIFR